MYSVEKIGSVHCGEDGFSIVLEPKYRAALTGLEGFDYIQVLCWFDGCDHPDARAVLTVAKPYVSAPDTLGVFATRAPMRPNPIALSAAYVTYIDQARGVVGLAWIDADDGTPVLDIKPYTPSVDRVENPTVPDWCADWPKNVESSGDFDWGAVFNF